MPTPLEIYKSVAKEFGVTNDKNVLAEAKLSFAREQSIQMKQIVNRLIFDITQSKVLEDSAKDDNTRSAYEGKRRSYENDLRQTVASLSTTLELVKELEDEVAED